MAREFVVLGTLRIAAGAQESDALDVHRPPGAVEVLTVFTPPVLTGDTVQVQVSAMDKVFRVLMHKGAEVAVSVPDRAYSIPVPACRTLRVVSNAAEAETRIFHVVALLEVG